MRCVFLCLLTAAPALAAEPKPNVLFLIADDLRAELGCYGSPAITPHLDGLAKRGVRFERAYCQQALCNPSRSSFLTGRRPDTLRQWNNGTHFRERNPDVVTLPQWFKEHGYVTRDVGKVFHNWHTKEKGDRRSWSADEFLYYANHGDDIPQVRGELPANGALDVGRKYGSVPTCERRDVPDESYYDGRIAAEAVRVLKEVKDKPFFLAVGFWKPHAPFNAPKKYWDLYDPAKLPALDPARPTGAPDLAFHDSREIRGAQPKQIDFTAAHAREMRHGYFAGISYMDAQVGKVLAVLDDLKLRDSTVIVFVADHGYHVGEHGLWGKTSCFELDARVPLLICPPRAANAGKSTAALVELIDLFPTMTGLCGLPGVKGLDGTDLGTILMDPTKAGKPAALTQHPRPAYYDRTEKGVPDAMGYSIRTAKVRYTEWRDWATGKVLARELYDHARDPGETRNVIDRPPDVAALDEAKELLNKGVPLDLPPAKR
ncbi:MAG TPA: sulfatase [Gemmataceae bacterium]|nr:sulfatase [Gemmataceae bacterium]